ncbi:MAG: small basic protein [Planctomycetes bacterium]|nr:small basic protein [Planctomycetota bacterium]
MSIHKSLVSKTKLSRHRNVLTRGERVAELKSQGQWPEGRSLFALPKVRVQKVKKRGKGAKKEKEKPA